MVSLSVLFISAYFTSSVLKVVYTYMEMLFFCVILFSTPLISNCCLYYNLFWITLCTLTICKKMKNKKYHTVKIVHITSIGKSCKDRPTQINCTVHTHDLVHALQSKVEGLRQFWRYQGAVRSRKWKKDRQYNVQKKKAKDKQWTTKHATNPTKTGVEFRCSGKDTQFLLQ